MGKVFFAFAVFSLSVGCAVCRADTAPFGVASAYNLVALGTVNSSGSTLIAGNVATTADVEGRIAAANQVENGTTIGATLGKDPFGALADGFAMVAGTGISARNYFQINGGGNVYAPTNSASFNWNENPKGVLVKTGPSPIDFATLRNTLDAETLQLSALTANGVVGAPHPPGANPSWLILSGSSKTLNVFTLTAAQFANTNHNLDIISPAGATVIINVEGTNVTLGTGIYFNGQQEGDNNNDNADILFNFADATKLTIDGQLDGAVLAPFASFSGSSQVGGNILVAAVNQTGEVHNIEFDGTLPSPPVQDQAPEPWTLALTGSGIVLVAGVSIWRRRAQVGASTKKL